MSNTLKLGNGKWATGKDTLLSFSDTNNNYKPLPFSFSRGTNATVVNEQGLIELVGSDEPRIDFKDNTKGSLLLEPSRTNKVSTSNDFNGSGWNISNLTATANQVISPDGTLNASKLEMTGNGSLRNQSEVSFNDGYAYSIFVKKGNSRYVTIRSAFFTQSILVGFDLDTLTAETNGKIENYGNDWYRLSIIKNISGDADRSGFFYLYLPNSLGSQTSVSGNYAYFYGGQIEDGSYATSYIPTNGSAATRVGDSSSQTNISNNIISSSYPFTMYVECKNVYGGGVALSFLDISSADKYFNISIVNNVVTAYSRANSSLENIISGIALTKGQKFKAAFTMESATSGKLAVNGIVISKTNFISQSTNVNINDLLLGQLRTISDTGDRLPIKDVRVYNTALTDAELQALTTI